MKEETKIIWPFVIFVIAYIIAALLFFNFILITKANYENIINHDTRFKSEESILVYYNLIRESNFINYMKSGLPEYLQSFGEYTQKSSRLYLELINNIPNKNLKKNYQQEYELFIRIVGIEKQVMNRTLAEEHLSSPEYVALKGEFRTSSDLPFEFSLLGVNKELKVNIAEANIFTTLMIITFVLAMFLVAVEFSIVKKDFINPMRQISQSLAEIREGKPGKNIHIKADHVVAGVIKDLYKTSSDLQSFSSSMKHRISATKGSNKKMRSKIEELSAEVINLQHMLKLALVNYNKEKKKQ